MLHMSVLADARGSPSVYVEALSSGKPMLADLLWPSWYEIECLALAFFTIVFHSAILWEYFFVRFEQMSTEAFRISTDA